MSASRTGAHGTVVLVLGGGLMGTTTAFFLRQHGLSVTLLERALVGRQASGTNFGNVRRQGRELHQMPLAHRARAVWGRIRELLGEDAEFVVVADHVSQILRLIRERADRTSRDRHEQLQIITQFLRPLAPFQQ